MSEYVRSDTPHLRESQLRPEAPNLAHLLAAARLGMPEAIDALLKRAEEGQLLTDVPPGHEHLLCACGDAVFAIPLVQLREVLPALPEVVPLPFSAPWLLGIFALRTDMLGLVDPRPVLLGHLASGNTDADGVVATPARRAEATPAPPETAFTTALVVGEGERSIALAMTSIGDIFLARDEDIVSQTETQRLRTTPLDARYISGIYRRADSGFTCHILAVDSLLASILAALEEEERQHG